MKIYIIDFSDSRELVDMCNSAGHKVMIERTDGGAAYRFSREWMPA